MNRNGRNFKAEYSNIPGRMPDARKVSGQNYVNGPVNGRHDQSAYRPARQAGDSQRPRVNMRNDMNGARGRPARGAYPNANNIRLNQGVRVDTLRPVSSGGNYQPRPRTQIAAQGNSRPKPRPTAKKRAKNSFLRDFLLGMGIGFAIFGTAAIFVVRAITDLLI